MADNDLRQRYEDTLLGAQWHPRRQEDRDRVLSALLAVRDDELTAAIQRAEQAEAALPQCNGICLRASDVLDDLSRVVGNPVARAHRSCPRHGDLEAAAWELDAALSKAEAIIARVRAAIARPVMCGPNAIPSVPVAAIHSALEGEA